MAGPKMTDEKLYLQAGIDPKTKKPTRLESGYDLFNGMKKIMRILDEQDAVNRYVWYNLPDSLTGQELERMLYYKGQLCFFYMEATDKFYLMPYALDGDIDYYGRFKRVHPVPFANGKDNDSKDYEKAIKVQAELLSMIKLNCEYEPILYEDEVEKAIKGSCVLLHDYTKQLAQTILPRQQLNDCLCNVESEVIAFLRTALLMATGVRGERVSDADAQASVDNACYTLYKCALEGKPFTSILSAVEIQELMNQSGLKAQEFTLALQSLDNLRLSTYGLNNGGFFEKKAHVLGQEEKINQQNSNIILDDGLKIRQNFCNIVNSIWGLGVWCETAESISNVDINQDGMTNGSDSDGSQSPVDTSEGGEE